MVTRRLIRGASVVTMDPAIGDVHRGDVLVEGDTIVAVGHDLGVTDAEVIDATGMIALPGLVDAHRHLWQALLRGVASNLSFRHYFRRVLVELAPRITPADVAVAHELATIEALDAGVTSVFDWSHIQNSPDHTDELVRALRASGLRVVFGYGPPMNDPREWLLPDSPHRHPVDEARRVRSVLADDAALVTMALGMRGPEYVGWDISVDDIALARELGLRAMYHVGDPRLTERRVIEGLSERGLLGPDLIHAGASVLSDEQLAMIRDSGGSIVTSPELALHIGQPWPRIRAMIEHGLAPGIGADMLAGYGGSPFALMRLTVQTDRLMTYLAAEADGVERPTMSSREVLGLMTCDGARAIGLGDVTGSLSPGKQADVVLLDATRPNVAACADPAAAVVHYADVSNVHTVMVAGEIRKRAGRLVGVDPVGVGERAAAARQALVGRR